MCNFILNFNSYKSYKNQLFSLVIKSRAEQTPTPGPRDMHNDEDQEKGNE